MLNFDRTTTTKNEPQVVIHKNVSDTNIFDELAISFNVEEIMDSA